MTIDRNQRPGSIRTDPTFEAIATRERVIAESAEPIDALIAMHGRRVQSLLARILGNAEDARDCWQETWCAVWRAIPRLDASLDPWPFIRQTAVRKAIDKRRADAARLKPEPMVAEPEDPARVAARAEAPTVDLSFLSREERACITLFFWEGLSVNEIATTLSVPPGTVKTWMFRGRARLRDQLQHAQPAKRVAEDS